MVTCKCGEELTEKSVRKHHIQLSNPGIVDFEAPSHQCHVCGEAIFVEEDADAVFDAFQEAYKRKNLQ